MPLARRSVKKMTSACELKTLPGLDFGQGVTAYRCEVSIPYSDGDEGQKADKAKLVKAFGESETTRLMAHDGAKDAWLNGAGMMDSMTVSLIVLTDAEGQVKQVIATESALKQSLKGVASQEGAAALIYLMNVLDNHPTNNLFASASFAAEGDGWTISKITQRKRLDYNNVIVLALHVSKSGEITKR